MRRRVFTALSTVSLVLCLSTAIFWARSYWRSDEVEWDRLVMHHAPQSDFTDDDQYWMILGSTQSGYFNIRSAPFWSEHGAVIENWNLRSTTPEPIPPIHRPRFIYERDGEDVWLVIPFWAIFAAFLLFPAIGGIQSCWRVRYLRLCCRTCGYDLRATPTRCPECGAAVSGVRA